MEAIYFTLHSTPIVPPTHIIVSTIESNHEDVHVYYSQV